MVGHVLGILLSRVKYVCLREAVWRLVLRLPTVLLLSLTQLLGVCLGRVLLRIEVRRVQLLLSLEIVLNDVRTLVRMIQLWWHHLSSGIVLTKVELKTRMSLLSLARIIRRMRLVARRVVWKRSRVLLRRVVLVLRVLDDFLRLNACFKQ